MAIPDGYHYADTDDFSGYDRPPHVVDNDVEIELHFAECNAHAYARPSFTCNYCGDTYMPQHRQDSERLIAAVHWFHAHNCATLERAEAMGIVYDLAA